MRYSANKDRIKLETKSGEWIERYYSETGYKFWDGEIPISFADAAHSTGKNTSYIKGLVDGCRWMFGFFNRYRNQVDLIRDRVLTENSDLSRDIKKILAKKQF